MSSRKGRGDEDGLLAVDLDVLDLGHGVVRDLPAWGHLGHQLRPGGEHRLLRRLDGLRRRRHLSRKVAESLARLLYGLKRISRDQTMNPLLSVVGAATEGDYDKSSSRRRKKEPYRN